MGPYYSLVRISKYFALIKEGKYDTNTGVPKSIFEFKYSNVYNVLSAKF